MTHSGQHPQQQEEDGDTCLVNGDLSEMRIASATVHPLYDSDPLISHSKLTSSSHNFSRILLGHNLGVSGTNCSPTVAAGPEAITDTHPLPCRPLFLESPSLARTSPNEGGWSVGVSQTCIPEGSESPGYHVFIRLWLLHLPIYS